MFVAMYSSVQGLCGLPLTQHCYVKPWAPCSSAQLCRHPLQACSKHSPLSSQQAPALLSSAKQLRAPGSSTVVTRVKHTLLLTHKTHARGLGTTHVRGHTEIGGVLFRDREKKGYSHSHSAVLTHVFSQAQHAGLHTCRKTCRTGAGNANTMCCFLALLMFFFGKGGEERGG